MSAANDSDSIPINRGAESDLGRLKVLLGWIEVDFGQMPAESPFIGNSRSSKEYDIKRSIAFRDNIDDIALEKAKKDTHAERDGYERETNYNYQERLGGGLGVFGGFLASVFGFTDITLVEWDSEKVTYSKKFIKALEKKGWVLPGQIKVKQGNFLNEDITQYDAVYYFMSSAPDYIENQMLDYFKGLNAGGTVIIFGELKFHKSFSKLENPDSGFINHPTSHKLVRCFKKNKNKLNSSANSSAICPLQESDFYDKAGSYLFGVDFENLDSEQFKMYFPFSEEQIREIFANHGVSLNGNYYDPHRAKPGKQPTETQIQSDLAKAKALTNRKYLDSAIDEAIKLSKDKDLEISYSLEEIKNTIEIRAGPFTYIYGSYRSNILYLDSPLINNPENHKELILTLIHEARVLAYPKSKDSENEKFARSCLSNKIFFRIISPKVFSKARNYFTKVLLVFLTVGILFGNVSCSTVYEKQYRSFKANMRTLGSEETVEILIEKLGEEEAIKLLLKKLHFISGDSGWYYDAVIKALVNIGEPALIEKLGDSDWEIRRAAAEALGKIGDKRAVQPLVKALEDSDPDVRKVVAEALAKFGDSRVVQPLIEALGDSDGGVRVAVAIALEMIGNKEAVQPLIEKLNDRDFIYDQVKVTKPTGRREVVYDLAPARGGRGGYRVIGRSYGPRHYVTKTTTVKNKAAKKAVIWALGQLGDSRALKPLRKQLKELKEDPKIGNEVLIALNKLKDPQLNKYLFKTIQNKDTKVREVSLRLLVNRGAEKIEDILFKTLTDDSPKLRQLALIYLSDKGIAPEKVAKRAISFLRNDSSELVRQAAALVLAGIDTQKAKEALVMALGDESGLVQQAAITSLDPRIDSEVASRLRPFLSSQNEEVRKTAAFSLGAHLGDFAQLQEDFRRLLADSNFDIRLAALVGLARSDASEAKELIKTALEDKHWYIRKNAALALSNSSDEYKEPLLTLLDDSNFRVKEAAIASLGSQVSSDAEIRNQFAKIIRDDPNWYIRQAAMFLADDIEQPQIYDAVISNLENDDWRLRQAMAVVLSKVETQAAISQLNSLLFDNNHAVRAASLASLSEKVPQHPELIDSIKPLLADSQPQVRYLAAQALSSEVQLHQDLVNSFVSLARQDDNLLVRTTATLGLGGINQSDIIDTLKTNLASDNWRLRGAAAHSLGRIDNPAVVELLAGALDDSHPAVRYETLSSLENRVAQFPELVKSIKPLLSDNSPQIRSLAVSSLGKMPTPEADINNVLLSALKDDSWRVRHTAVDFLTKDVKDFSQVKEVFEAGLADKNPLVRQRAIRSLGKFESPKAADLLISSARDDHSSAGELARLMLVQKAFYRNEIKLPDNLAKELKPFVDEYRSNKGAIVMLYEGLHLSRGVRQSGWSEGLLLKDTLDFMEEVSGGKIKVIEGNWSGNMMNNASDVSRIGEDLYKYWQLAKDTNRDFYVVANSYMNKMGPRGFEYAQEKYDNPEIKADLFIGTGNPGGVMLTTTSHLRKASIKEPIMIGSRDIRDDPWFKAPYLFGRDPTAQYTILPNVSHSGQMGYFDHPMAVSTIIDQIGFTAPPLARMDYYQDKMIQLPVKRFPWMEARPDNLLQRDFMLENAYFNAQKRTDMFSIDIPKIEPIRFEPPSLIDNYQFKNLTNPNRWSDLAVSPGGTSFNPDYMSTPPPGLIQPPTFDPGNISVPPPGAVNINPGIPGGAPYTGGTFTPPPIPEFKPIQPIIKIPNSDFNN